MNGAIFSADRVHRYRLERQWGDEPACAFILLNPSTADETQDDPTVRRCIRYAKDWGYGSLIVVNIFGLRSTDPKALYKHPDPEGPDNRINIFKATRDAEKVICAWGAHGKLNMQGRKVLTWLHGWSVQPYVLRCTDSGEPGHPLYLPASLKPVML